MCCAIFVHLMCCVCVCVYLWKTNHPFVIVSPSYYFVILTWANISDDSMRPSNLEWTLLLRVLLSFFVFFCFCFGWFGLNCRASSILYCKYLISAHFTWLDVFFQNISIPKYLFTLKFIIVTPIYPQFFGVYISILYIIIIVWSNECEGVHCSYILLSTIKCVHLIKYLLSHFYVITLNIQIPNYV